ncbi:helix-turn-helix domain-containing protein [Streptomyces sp. NPDC096198]|uniref:helix-turn-helix domain-containing protein n=1 Tax=Streptomyces sp. NPDC096198 TaxID=3366080 RepID=UPI0038262049
MSGPPPGAGAPACARLAGELRGLRARTGLSLAELAARSPYSTSSWERYLSGRQLPPREAVVALCTLAAEPPERLTALWEPADLEGTGRARSATRPASPLSAARPGTGDVRDRTPPDGADTPHRTWALIAAACAAGVLAAVGGVAAWAHEATGDPVVRATSTAPPAPGCTAEDPGLMGRGTPGEARALGPAQRTSTGARPEIRYNPRCAAAWARLWHARIGDALDIAAPGGGPQRAAIADRYVLRTGGRCAPGVLPPVTARATQVSRRARNR